MNKIVYYSLGVFTAAYLSLVGLPASKHHDLSAQKQGSVVSQKTTRSSYFIEQIFRVREAYAETITQKNIAELRKSGWTVFDTEELIRNRPIKKWRYMSDFQTIMKNRENEILKSIIPYMIYKNITDGRKESDKISSIFVSEDGYIALNIEVYDTTNGVKRPDGIYAVLATRKGNPVEISYLKYSLCPNPSDF